MMEMTTTASEQRILLRNVSWDAYVSLAQNSDRAGRLITYDQGLMEIMSPSKMHESDKSMLGRMVEMFSLERNIDIASSASTTFQRSDLQRAFEADESYYIQNERLIRGKRELDLAIDPPPDLVIEIEVTRSAINKLPLLAAMGVPEVWRYHGNTIWMGRCDGDRYLAIDRSEVLDGFPVRLAEEILAACGTASETALIRKFVASLKTV